MIVQVYYNRTRKCWSVRHNGRVIEHVLELELSNCTMRVCEAARQRVVLRRRRDVHAWIKGSKAKALTTPMHLEEITYNPFHDATFKAKKDGRPIFVAELVRFASDGRCYINAKG